MHHCDPWGYVGDIVCTANFDECGSELAKYLTNSCVAEQATMLLSCGHIMQDG